MSRDVEVDNAPSIMCENDKHEQNFKPHCMDGEEVDGNQLRYVIVEERSPRLRWWLRTADHVFGDRSLGDLNSKFEQFAVDPRRTPKRILTAHCSNQIASFLWNLGGLTIIRLERQADQTRDSQTQRQRSIRVSTGRRDF
jgi:hypothetical protein